MAAKKQLNPRGPQYSLEFAQQICEMVAEGSNLTRISQIPGMPAFSTMAKWMRKNPAFSEDYGRARESRADSRADRIDAIAEKLERGEIDSNTARVLVEIEKWQAGKEKPRSYGDKIDVNQTVVGEVRIIVGGDAQ